MKYKPTPFNITCVILTIVAIDAAINRDPEGWTLILTFGLMPIIISGLVFDFVFQNFGYGYNKVLKIEFLILLIFLFWYCWPK